MNLFIPEQHLDVKTVHIRHCMRVLFVALGVRKLRKAGKAGKAGQNVCARCKHRRTCKAGQAFQTSRVRQVTARNVRKHCAS
jgi:hypothetical protein